MYPTQPKDFAPNKVGVTEAERQSILEEYKEHLMTGKSRLSFVRHSPQTMKRVAERNPDFSKRMEQIEREATGALEDILISKMKDDDKPINLRAFELLTRNRKHFKEPKEEEHPPAQRIEIVSLNSRADTEQFQQLQEEE